MKLIKGKFEILLRVGGKKTVDGFMSKHFGIYKDFESKYHCISHLKSQKMITMFVSLKIARTFVNRAELMEWPVPWDGNLDDISRNNGDQVRALRAEVLKE